MWSAGLGLWVAVVRTDAVLISRVVLRGMPLAAPAGTSPGDAPGHERDRGSGEERFRVLDEPFVVSSMPASVHHPGQRPLDHPAAGLGPTDCGPRTNWRSASGCDAVRCWACAGPTWTCTRVSSLSGRRFSGSVGSC